MRCWRDGLLLPEKLLSTQEGDAIEIGGRGQELADVLYRRRSSSLCGCKADLKIHVNITHYVDALVVKQYESLAGFRMRSTFEAAGTVSDKAIPASVNSITLTHFINLGHGGQHDIAVNHLRVSSSHYRARLNTAFILLA